VFKKLDIYIIRKFFGTFFFTLALFMVIVIVFDVAEKLDNFIDNNAPLHSIIFDYYINFIPYFAVLFAPLFLFIAVIFFTSRLAAASEIIAILNSGVTFNRLLRPYIFCAIVIAALDLYANNWLIPDANKTRLKFENTYVNDPYVSGTSNFHLQMDKNLFVYLLNFDYSDSLGRQFAIDRFNNNGRLIYKLRAQQAKWIYKQKAWEVSNYTIRLNDSMHESLWSGRDTMMHLNFKPKDFKNDIRDVATLNFSELNDYIALQKSRGANNVAFYEVEKYQRTSFPFAIIVLTVIAVAMSSRRIRGGTGLYLGVGIGISFCYILFLQFSKTFSTNANLPAALAVWIPNIIFSFLAFYLYWKAPK
jgi:lipopolysaccharide export system permease protein